MAFLRNDAINRVNLHTSVQALARGAGSIFFLVFLLRAGVSVPAALTAQAAIVAARFVIRPLLLPIAKRTGLKPLLIAGTLLIALQYPLLAQVTGVDRSLLILCAVTALGDLAYYLAYNTYFAMLGDARHRGHQIAAREAAIAVIGIVAPLAGAGALVSLGPTWTFAAVGVIQALSVLPLLGLPNIAVAKRAPGALRAARPAIALLTVDGWIDACLDYVWYIALFVSLGHSIAAYGGAMALAGVVGALFGLWVGPHVDAGHGRRTLVIAYGVAAVIVLLRASSLDTPWLAAGANAAGAVLMPLLLPALAGATYNLAQTSPCPFRFHMGTEGGWDLGAGAACLCAAGLTAMGASLAWPLLLALPGIAVAAALLWRYYGRPPLQG